jgi:5-methylcytosine-specific restriction enzyme A
MTLLLELKPKKLQRVIDLVEKSGVDVSDWKNYARGKTNPGANPKYCYEWALVQPRKLVVCNLWYSSMREIDGQIEQHLTLRDTSTYVEPDPTRRARRGRMEKAFQDAFEADLPVRVIVLDGKPSGSQGKNRTKVFARMLDPVAWSVVSFDSENSKVGLRRGSRPSAFADQFSLASPKDGDQASYRSSVLVRNRSSEVRKFVLLRSDGYCELCGKAGFTLPDGRIFLETHHVKPLANGGVDGVSNVVALCANDHREAHFGRNAEKIRRQLEIHLASKV